MALPSATLGLAGDGAHQRGLRRIGGACIPNPATLRWDDIAALNRLYPITAANLASFPGKQITAANTISIRGTVSFANGYGMQGVNVVARPLDANGNPLYEYTVTAVSGPLFNGNHGNPVTGWDGCEREPADHVGLGGRSRAGMPSTCAEFRCPRSGIGQLPGHLRSDRSALRPGKRGRPLYRGPSRPWGTLNASRCPIWSRAARKR